MSQPIEFSEIAVFRAALDDDIVLVREKLRSSSMLELFALVDAADLVLDAANDEIERQQPGREKR